MFVPQCGHALHTLCFGREPNAKPKAESSPQQVFNHSEAYHFWIVSSCNIFMTGSFLLPDDDRGARGDCRGLKVVCSLKLLHVVQCLPARQIGSELDE